MGKWHKRYRRLRREVEGLRLHALSRSAFAGGGMFDQGEAQAYADMRRRLDAVCRAYPGDGR